MQDRRINNRTVLDRPGTLELRQHQRELPSMKRIVAAVAIALDNLDGLSSACCASVRGSASTAFVGRGARNCSYFSGRRNGRQMRFVIDLCGFSPCHCSVMSFYEYGTATESIRYFAAFLLVLAI